MAKIKMLVPRSYMVDQAEKVIRDNGFTVDSIKVIETVDTVVEARKCIEEGANIIVARGVQAELIKSYTNIPVAEISMTAQEIGLLVVECKKIIKKKIPTIAIVSLKNMINDISYFDKLFDIKLNCYFTDNFDQMEQAVENAIKDGADIILGGDHVIRCVEKYNIPVLFLRSTEDSIRGALQLAEKMGYAIDVEKSSNAQLETMLDTAFNGIIKIDSNHKILIVNHIVEELLKKPVSEIVGKQLEDEFIDIDRHAIENILTGERDNYSTSIKIKGKPLLLLVAPIRYDNDIIGAILSCSRIKNVPQSDSKTIQDMYLYGYIAKFDFASLKTNEPKLRECIELGKKYALSKHPVLIYGEEGTEMEVFAQCIHNNSSRKTFPFLMVNCSAMSDIEQYNYLFGANTESDGKGNTSGVFQTCNYGTVYINEIEKLNLTSQYGIYKAICFQGLMSGDMKREKHYDVRIIAGTHTDLRPLVKKGLFREDLYYSINALTLDIPPLRNRGEDIEKMVKQYLQEFTETHTTHLTIADEAMKVIKEYKWEGNLIQLENFCERLFLTTYKKNIDQAMVIRLLNELYPDVRTIDGEERVVVYKYPEAAVIVDILKKHKGNRKAASEELNISTTTLWRKMKKYGITNDYEF